MPDNESDLPTGGDIVDAARNAGDGLGYKLYGYGQGTPAGQPKDHHFVADTLDKAGIGFGDDTARPAIAHWADPDTEIPGWAVVRDGSIQPGDVLATAKPVPLSSYHGGGQQLGIATGNGTSIGIVDNDRVGESDFGHREGHDPVVRRSENLASANAAQDDKDLEDDITAGSALLGGAAGRFIGGGLLGPAGQLIGGVGGALIGRKIGRKAARGQLRGTNSGPDGSPGSPGNTD